MKGFFIRVFHRLFKKSSDPVIVARTIALGLFVSFSPYLGLQTWLAFPLSWLFGVEAKLVIFILYTVNNPWFMVPIAALDYLVGQRLMGIIGMDLTPYNPLWMQWVNRKLGSHLTKYFGITELSLWNYIIGGNVLALCISLGLYPLIKRVSIRIKAHHLNTHEDHHTK